MFRLLGNHGSVGADQFPSVIVTVAYAGHYHNTTAPSRCLLFTSTLATDWMFRLLGNHGSVGADVVWWRVDWIPDVPEIKARIRGIEGGDGAEQRRQNRPVFVSRQVFTDRTWRSKFYLPVVLDFIK